MTTPHPGGTPWPPSGPPPGGQGWASPGAGPPQWGPPPPPGGPGWPPGGAPPPSDPPTRRRTGLVLALAAVALALVLVTAVVAVSLTGGGDDQAVDFGPGPGTEPEEEWVVDLDVDLDESGGAHLRSDGDVVVVAVDAPGGLDEEVGLEVHAYSAAEGEELWDLDLASGSFGDPVVMLGDGEVLVTEYHDEAGATTRLLDSRTGDERWEADGRPFDQLETLLVGSPFRPPPSDHILLLGEDDDGDSTSVVIDGASGDELWSDDGSEALSCGDVVITVPREDDEESGELDPRDHEVTGRDAATGDELWTVEGLPGLCDDGVLAVTTDDDEVTLVDTESGEGPDPIDVGGDAEYTHAAPFGDHVLVTQYSFTEESESTRTAIYPRDGGDATWEDDGSFGLPLGDDIVLAGDIDGDDGTLVRASDGEELDELGFPSSGSSCEGAITRRTLVTCETGDSDVTSYDIRARFEELWTVDVGADVVEATVGGNRLFVVTGEGELVALR